MMLLLLAFTQQPSAQTTAKTATVVQYTLTHVIDTTQPGMPVTRPFTLVLDNKLSRYDDYYQVLWELGTPAYNSYTDASGKVVRMPVASGGNSDQVIKNFTSNKMTTITLLGQNYYAIEEPMPTIKWNMLPEQKTISGYSCQKATTAFKGRNYTAWFTAKLPYRNGPWKLGDLPGLILEAYDEKNEVHFVFNSINTAAPANPIELSSEVTPVDRVKFNRLKAAVLKDKEALKGASEVRASNVSVSGGMRAGGGQLRPSIEFNNPIEKN